MSYLEFDAGGRFQRSWDSDFKKKLFFFEHSASKLVG